ncbi:MAG: hypothetical protein ACYTKD_20045 [Planctomycetota bacterium]|jgi:uncharacterized radical SAM superfamily Fe-S cluster-containing enzyme
MDGFRESTHLALRGRDMREVKAKALGNLEKHDINTNILAVVGKGINEDEVGEILSFGIERHFVRSVNYHTLAFTGSGGRDFARDHENVTTLPDIMKLIEAQSEFMRMSDFSPIPAPHPLCESNTYLLMTSDGKPPIPVPRLMEKGKYPEVFENVAVLRPDDRLRVRLKAVIDYLDARGERTEDTTRALEFFRQLTRDCFPERGHVSQEERARICERAIKAVFLIPYMDEFNLDLTRLRACVAMQALPDGRLVPSCACYPLHRYADKRLFPDGRPVLA